MVSLSIYIIIFIYSLSLNHGMTNSVIYAQDFSYTIRKMLIIFS